VGQQSHQQSEEEEQQSEEEEQQEEDEVEEPQEEVQDAAMAKECDMTPRLQFWYGNSKDRTSIEWWCDAVDRIKDQKGWNNDQGKKSAASVAVDALREDASLLMSIIAKGHQAAAVKDWSLMKLLLIKRYSTIKTCTQRAKQFTTLAQKSGDIQVVDYVEAEMTILGRTKTRPILVVKGLSTTEAILGYDYIKQEGLVVDGARNDEYFSKEVPHAAAWSIATLRASKEMTLEPRSVHKVQANPFVVRHMLLGGDLCVTGHGRGHLGRGGEVGRARTGHGRSGEHHGQNIPST
jgi:hypothetical protein